MKNIINTIAVLAIFIAFVSQALAGGTTTTTTTSTNPATSGSISLPIQSRGTLKAYASEQVTGGYTSIGSSSQVQKAGDTNYVNVSGSSPKSIANQLSAAALKFHSYNTSDIIYSNTALTDSNWNLYFYGFGQGGVIASGSTGILSVPNITMQLADPVPLKEPGAVWAYAVFRDANGNIMWENSLQVNNGIIYFPQSYTGQIGEVRVGINNTSGRIEEHVVSIQTGLELPTTLVSGSISTSIENYMEVTDNGYANGVMLSATGNSAITDPSPGQSSPPVVRVTLTSARAVSVKWGLTVQGYPQSAEGVWYYKQGDSVEYHLPVTTDGMATAPILQPGTYYFYFDYSAYEAAPTQPIYTGGGG